MKEFEWKKMISSVILLYIIITNAFSLLNRLSSYFIAGNVGITKTRLFFTRNLFWVIIVLLVIYLLYKYNKKLNYGSFINPLEDIDICKATGAVVMLQTIINFSSLMPLHIMSIYSTYEAIKLIAGNSESMLLYVVVENIISIILMLLEFTLGIYMFIFYKRKEIN